MLNTNETTADNTGPAFVETYFKKNSALPLHVFQFQILSNYIIEDLQALTGRSDEENDELLL